LTEKQWLKKIDAEITPRRTSKRIFSSKNKFKSQNDLKEIPHHVFKHSIIQESERTLQDLSDDAIFLDDLGTQKKLQ